MKITLLTLFCFVSALAYSQNAVVQLLQPNGESFNRPSYMSVAGDRLIVPTYSYDYVSTGGSLDTIHGGFDLYSLGLAYHGAILFSIDSGNHGAELYSMDTASRTITLIKDINPAGSSYPNNFVLFGGKVYFDATNGGNEGLYVTDGTTAGTQLVKHFNTFVGPGEVSDLTVYHNELCFTLDGILLGVSDGTTAGSRIISEVKTTSCASGNAHIGNFGTSFQDTIWGMADVTCAFVQTNFFRFDGTHSGYAFDTLYPHTIFDSILIRNDYGMFPFRGRLFFVASDRIHGDEWWSTDGTPAGTAMLKDIHAGPGSAFAYAALFQMSCTIYHNELYFMANDSIHGAELWKTDGTDAGTVIVKDIHPGQGDGLELKPFCLYDNKLFFAANNNGNNAELWSTDGTASGTSMAADVWPGTGHSSAPADFVSFKGYLYFSASIDTIHRKLFRYGDTTSVLSAIHEYTADQPVLYPNPVTDHIVLTAHQGDVYHIYDLVGRSITSGRVDNETIPTSDLRAGIYTLQISDERHLYKFVKE